MKLKIKPDTFYWLGLVVVPICSSLNGLVAELCFGNPKIRDEQIVDQLCAFFVYILPAMPVCLPLAIAAEIALVLWSDGEILRFRLLCILAGSVCLGCFFLGYPSFVATSKDEKIFLIGYVALIFIWAILFLAVGFFARPFFDEKN